MNVSGESSRSIWMSAAPVMAAAPLQADTHTDVVIIGSGIAGMSVAYELAKAGRSVIVLDRGPIGLGMTARTTAHLSCGSDDGFDALIKMRGLELAKGWRDSQAAAIDRIETIQRDNAIACDFRRVDGFLFHAPGSDRDIIEREHRATLRIGMPVTKEKGVPLRGHEATPTLRYPDQATFHPLKYMKGLAEAISQAGGRFYANTTVTSVEESVSGVEVVTANGPRVLAKAAVVSTNAPINDRLMIHTKQAPYRTYAMAFHIPRGALADGLYWDTLDPYHYVRLQPDDSERDIVVVGGEDHKTGEANDAGARFRALEDWTREALPDLGAELARWSGQVLEPIDFAGFIGRNPGNDDIYISSGDSGQGMTHGALAGMLISDLILNGESVWARVYDPGRKPVMALGAYLSENMTVAKNFAEYVAPGEVASLDALAQGEGAILRRGLKKIAAYRSFDGRLFLKSAACTHVGCHLHWNSFEQCWDCPCHGSQFAPNGDVLNGPAVTPLPDAENEP